ncbi:MAG: zinc-dependent metalloprotease [Chitinophagales bacterium]|nr:zinc-dependent metalloprotease [Chitinophagales bacterium]
MAIDPSYEQNRENLELLIKNFTENNSNNARKAAITCQKDANYFEIPVVVHVMHLGEPIGVGSNTSDADIQLGLDDANALITRDLGIKLILAKRDPNGQATNGIRRVDCSHLTNYVNHGVVPYGFSPVNGGVSDTLIKDLSRWSVQDYVNIYIVAKIDYPGASGYSSFPFLSPRIQGVVCRTSAYNSNNLAHELGHFFNLAHTFEGSSDTQCAPNDGTGGDGVADTPPIRMNDCGTTSSCGDYPNVNNSIMNVMGYCSKPNSFFTPGQRARVKASLYSNYQWSLLKSLGLIIPNISGEVALDSVDYDFTTCGGIITPKVHIINYGNPITSIELQMNIDSKDTTMVIPINGLNKGEKQWITLPYTFVLKRNSTGTRSIKFEVKKIFNGSTQLTEQNIFNNVVCKDVYAQRDIEYKITPNVTPEGSAQIVGDTLVCQYHIETYSLTNIDACAKFLGWFVNNIRVSDSTNYTIQALGNKTIEARFENIIFYTEIRPEMVNGIRYGDVYDFNDGTILPSASSTPCLTPPVIKTVVARPHSGFMFSHWEDYNNYGAIISTDSIYNITIDKRIRYIAVFIPIPTTSIVNNSSLSEVSIYPNPTSHTLLINFNSQKANNISLLITDMKGSTIERKNISSTKGVQSVLVDVSQYAKGSYILHLQDEKGTGNYSFIVQ